jgi:hypothetical protein
MVTIVFLHATVYPEIRIKFTAIGAAPSIHRLPDIIAESINTHFVSFSLTKIVNKLWEREISSINEDDIEWLKTIMSTIEPKQELRDRWDLTVRCNTLTLSEPHALTHMQLT